MKVFISGGCKNGKSYYAQRWAKWQANEWGLYYVATMAAVDSEDEERIARHQDDRDGWGFTTIEQPTDINKICNISDTRGSFLLDSLTALLGNEMFMQDGTLNTQAHEKIWDDLQQVLSQIDNIVIVSDYMYSDAFIFEPLTEMYRKNLAALDTLLAHHCDIVLEVSYNQVIMHKGNAF